ncbi:uncharacterized protein F5147DRAFT_774099 [Suillus discolor]|uniref:Uncharacterized protein n=1 Tax=Suillus discolor TaxID=1912936 RepID=A0A9P7F5W5_9AGAM|nr:uncharacterized protein F5147DRAFT_774099 [Suillus discolor]KAG2107651.1 hypothetical protein F5147DRAFT_774099 [Suillus discolor]
MTTKAKVALEEKVIGTSKKQKPVNDADGDNTTAQLKKAKTHPAAGNASTGNLTAVNQGSVTSSIEPSKSPTLAPAVMSCRAIVHTEEEEATLSTNEVDLDSKESESGSQSSKSESESKEDTSEDQLKQMMKDWNSPVYASFDPTPRIVEINGCHCSTRIGVGLVSCQFHRYPTHIFLDTPFTF